VFPTITVLSVAVLLHEKNYPLEDKIAHNDKWEKSNL
jgi:hypothetical protein